MAQSINKVILVGNLTRDPEVRDLEGGDKVASFGMATNESWTDKASGERRERTEYHNVVVFNQGLIGVIKDYLRKGSRAYVEGSLQTREYVDREGATRQTTEIVLPRFRGEMMMLDSRQSQPGEAPAERQAAAAAKPAAPVIADPDDIPF